MNGLGILLRFHARRDRWMVTWWVLGGTVLYVSQAVSIDGLYATQAEFDTAAQAMASNSAFIAMAGPARALNTVGGQVMWQASAFGSIVAGLMSMFLIGRHTRAEEESGREELIRALPVDRRTTAVAALVVAAVANLALGLGVALSLIAYGLAIPDSVATGVGVMAMGWLFAGFTLVAVQLTASTRGAYGIVGIVLGASYVLRGLGDLRVPQGGSLLSWCSPIGWYQAMHPYSGLRWWPLLIILAATAAAVICGSALFSRRDLGSGLLASRPGPASAPAGLRSGFGLAWRLQRASVAGWSLGMALMGLAYGAMGNDVGSLIGDSQTTRDLFTGGSASLTDGFFATAAALLALMVTGFAVTSALRPRAEEDAGHLELLSATALTRCRWLAGHVTVTVVGSVVVVCSAAVGLIVGYTLVTGDAGRGFALGWPVVEYVPAVLFTSACARLIYGVLPARTALAWLPVVWAAVVLLFGDLWRLPTWAKALSPFDHLPAVPLEQASPWPVLGVATVALLVSVAGQIAFWRRDLH